MAVITGMMNTGMITTGAIITGFTTPMVTTAFTMYGGIRGGGTGIGGELAGVITGTGISFMPDSMWSGIKVDAGGSVRVMVAG